MSSLLSPPSPSPASHSPSDSPSLPSLPLPPLSFPIFPTQQTFHIGIDFDDVLFHFCPKFIAYCQEKYSLVPRKWEEITSSYFKDIFILSDDEESRYEDEKGIQIIYNELMGNVEAWNNFHFNLSDGEILEYKKIHRELKRLKKIAGKIVIVTARSQLENEDVLRRFCQTFYPDIFTDFFFCNLFSENGIRKSKGQICKENNISVLIDDSLHHVEDALQYEVIGIPFGKNPWTKASITEWTDLIDYLYQLHQFYHYDIFFPFEVLLSIFASLIHNVSHLSGVDGSLSQQIQESSRYLSKYCSVSKEADPHETDPHETDPHEADPHETDLCSVSKEAEIPSTAFPFLAFQVSSSSPSSSSSPPEERDYQVATTFTSSEDEIVVRNKDQKIVYSLYRKKSSTSDIVIRIGNSIEITIYSFYTAEKGKERKFPFKNVCLKHLFYSSRQMQREELHFNLQYSNILPFLENLHLSLFQEIKV